ncbi:hypothetical protein [Rhodococcus sp. NPDC060176]|uniref:hypothetical protein n=1 Tax=Rhodococcus sp. NPDC060176 TaxID=3347062 RepID=UPI003663AA0F
MRITEIFHPGLAKAKAQGFNLQVEGFLPGKVTTFDGACISGHLVLQAAYG